VSPLQKQPVHGVREIITVYSEIRMKHIINSVGEMQRVLILLRVVHIITTVPYWERLAFMTFAMLFNLKPYL
jgi:hypothetical protein